MPSSPSSSNSASPSAEKSARGEVDVKPVGFRFDRLAKLPGDVGMPVPYEIGGEAVLQVEQFRAMGRVRDLAHHLDHDLIDRTAETLAQAAIMGKNIPHLLR